MKKTTQKKIKEIENPLDFIERFKDRPEVISVLKYFIHKCIEKTFLVEIAKEMISEKKRKIQNMVKQIRDFENKHREEFEAITGKPEGCYADLAANYLYCECEDLFDRRYAYGGQIFRINENTRIFRDPELEHFAECITIQEISKQLKISNKIVSDSIEILINQGILELNKKYSMKHYKITDQRYFDLNDKIR